MTAVRAEIRLFMRLLHLVGLTFALGCTDPVLAIDGGGGDAGRSRDSGRTDGGPMDAGDATRDAGAVDAFRGDSGSDASVACSDSVECPGPEGAFTCLPLPAGGSTCVASISRIVVGGETGGGGGGGGRWALVDELGVPTTNVSAMIGSPALYAMDDETFALDPPIAVGQSFAFVGGEASEEVTKTFQFFALRADDPEGEPVMIAEINRTTESNGTASMVLSPTTDEDDYLRFTYAADGSGVSASFETDP